MTAPVAETPRPRTVVRGLPTDTAPLAKVSGSGSGSQLALSQTLMVLGLLTIWTFTYLFVLSDFQQGHAQHRLYSELRTQLALGEAPAGAPITVGAPVALLSIPEAGVDDEVIVEGTSATMLQRGPGHALGSVLPGQEGVSVLMGRALSFGAPFGRIPDLQRGSDITVTTVQGTFHYDVLGVRRKGDPVPPAVPTGGSRLTLVTGAGAGRYADLAPSDTVYVDANLKGEAQPAGAIAAADQAGAPFARDSTFTTLAVLVLALQLLVAAVALVVWARHRWSPVAAWVAGVPIVLATLWLVSMAASRLLPNLV